MKIKLTLLPRQPVIRWEKYPDLKYLMEQFHQDWKDFYRSDRDLLRGFVRDEESALVRRVLVDIRVCLLNIPDPLELDALLRKEWQSQIPYSSRSHARRWLKKAEKILQSELKNPTAAKEQVWLPGPNIEKYPGLYFLMCQFDELWREVFRSERNLLRQFRKMASQEDLEACVGDIHRILKAGYSDDDLIRILKDEFRGRLPFRSKAKVRPWLNHVLAVYRDVKPGKWRNYF